MEFPVTRPLENHQHHLPWPDHRQLQPPTVSSLSAWPSPTCSFSQARKKNQAFVCTFLISVHSLGNTLSPSPVLLLLHPRRHTQHCLRSPQGLAPCLRGRSPCWGGSGWSQLGCPHQKPLPGHQPACPALSCVPKGSGVTLPVPGSPCSRGRRSRDVPAQGGSSTDAGGGVRSSLPRDPDVLPG